MDALTAVIVWGVIWFVMIGVFPFVGFLVGAFLGALFDDLDDTKLTLGAFLGWVVGGVGSVFALIQVILHIVSLVKILN